MSTAIEWTETTWNPTTGCDRVSPGCGLPRPGTDDEETGLTGGCYAMTLAKRLKAMGQPKYQKDGDPRTSGPGFGVTVHEDTLGLPLRWRTPRRVFVNSMSDLFHHAVPDEFIAAVFAVMLTAEHHTFQVLTKRHGRMRSLLNDPYFASAVFSDAATDWGFDPEPDQYPHLWPAPNVWLGVSVEDQHWADIRVPALLDTPAAVRFISAEPLLGPVALPITQNGPRLHWVIAGGESGPGARPMHPAWVEALCDDCAFTGTPFFFKQWGEWTPDLNGPGRRIDVSAAPGFDIVTMRRAGKKAAGRILDGRTWDRMPTRHLRLTGGGPAQHS